MNELYLKSIKNGKKPAICGCKQTKIKDLNKKYNDTMFTTSKQLSKIKEIFN